MHFGTAALTSLYFSSIFLKLDSKMTCALRLRRSLLTCSGRSVLGCTTEKGCVLADADADNDCAAAAAVCSRRRGRLVVDKWLVLW